MHIKKKGIKNDNRARDYSGFVVEYFETLIGSVFKTAKELDIKVPLKSFEMVKSWEKPSSILKNIPEYVYPQLINLRICGEYDLDSVDSIENFVRNCINLKHLTFELPFRIIQNVIPPKLVCLKLREHVIAAFPKPLPNTLESLYLPSIDDASMLAQLPNLKYLHVEGYCFCFFLYVSVDEMYFGNIPIIGMPFFPFSLKRLTISVRVANTHWFKELTQLKYLHIYFQGQSVSFTGKWEPSLFASLNELRIECPKGNIMVLKGEEIETELKRVML